MARYIMLANNIISNIEDKQLVIGQRMPSIRKFASIYEVSITTALNCYQRLQDLGWLNAKPQSGYFVCQPFGKESQPNFPHFKAGISHPKSLALACASFHGPFYVSQIAPELLPLNTLNLCFKIGYKRNTEIFHLYPEYQGLSSLRTSLAQHFSAHYFHIDERKLVVTNGCIDAIKTAVEVTTSPGDVIAISSPCFNGLLELLANMGREVIEIPCFQAELDLIQLEHHLKTKTIKACLLSANYINPQGISLNVAQKQRIAELAEKYQTPIIEDDIYLELSHTPTTSLPIKHWDKAGWVLWCGSISKSISPSYRLGWCEPGRYFDKYLQHRSVQYFGVNLSVQSAINEFIFSGHYWKHVKKVRLKLCHHLRQYYDLFRTNLPKEARISTPQGGLVIWLQIPGLNSKKLLEQSIKHDIVFRAGNEFSTLELYNDCFRINIGWPISSLNHADEHSRLRYQQLLTLCELVKVNVNSV